MTERKSWIVNTVLYVGLSILLVGVAVNDLQHCRVPNVISLPLLLVAVPLNASRWLAGALSLQQLGLVAVAWAVCLMLWRWRVFGGGDVKLAMALLGLLPTTQFVNTLVVVLALGHLAILLIRDGRANLRRVQAIVVSAAFTQTLPSPAEIRSAALARRSPVAYLISAAGVIYMGLDAWQNIGGR